MKELSSVKHFNFKRKIQKELRKKIFDIFMKFNSLDSLQLKNDYLNKYHRCEKMINLINFTDENIDRKLINITEINQRGFFIFNHTKKIDYINILDESPDFSAGVFLIPAGKRIPLRNHPNILVISKVIWGKVLINCFDVVNNDERQIEEYDVFQIEEKEKFTLKLNDISILTPYKNNIHEVKAYENSALFNIVLPTYDDNEENTRRSEYYEILNIANSDPNNIFLRKI